MNRLVVKLAVLVPIVTLLSIVIIGQTSLAQDELSLGGGMVGSVPQVVGEYRLESFGLEAGLGISDSEAVFSAGGRYYADFWKDLTATPYLGGGLFFLEGNKAPPAPPPPPNPSTTASTGNEQQGLQTAVSFNGGLEISMPFDQLPFSVWAGAVYVPGSGGLIDSGISVGLKLRL